MKSTITGLILICSYLFSYGQVEIPYFGKISYLKGFNAEISGENIAYTSAVPEFATTALLTRCTDGHYDIEWETEPLPAGYNEEFAYFAWLAAYSKGTSKGDRNFDLYVDGSKALTFTTIKQENPPSWTVSGSNGISLVFEKKMEDWVGDIHGFMYLKVPVKSISQGKPVRLRIVGQAQDSRDWYMTFKYDLKDSVRITPLSLITKEGMQPLELAMVNFGAASNADVSVDGETPVRFDLVQGFNSFQIYHSAVEKVTRIVVEVKIPGKEKQSFEVELKPVTFREIHLIHHAHYDVGYSHLQEEVINIHNQNIANALRYIERTSSYPEEAKFRWNIETTLAIENFLKIATPDQKARLIDAIRKGYIGVGAIYANIQTGICQPEELFNLTRYARQLEKEYGLQLPAAMMGDIPGMTWATVPALVRSGIRYFSDGPNYTGSLLYEGDRVGNSNINWKDKPFWWVSPSGEEKLLFWMAGKGYSSWHGFKAGEIGTPKGIKRISAYMEELDQKGYPYEMVQWRYNIGADNGPTDSLVSDFVRNWNEHYKSPKIRLSIVEALFAEFEDRYGDQLPRVSGDFTPYWEDGTYSTTLETAQNRRNSEKLINLTTLFALRDPASYPEDLFEHAWKAILLWDEHTWGAYNSISDPDLPFVISQWKYKRNYLLKSDSLIGCIEKQLIQPESSATIRGSVDVFNTCSWNRKDVVYLDQYSADQLYRIRDEKGSKIPFQRLSDGRVALLLQVPALSFTRLSLDYKKTEGLRSFSPLPKSEVDNDHISLSVSPITGSIASFRIKDIGFELADSEKFTGLNEFLYVPGRDPAKALTTEKPEILVTEEGSVLSRIQIKSNAPGCNSLKREITLYKDLERVEIENTIDKKAIREKEGVHFAFPFRLTAATERFNTGWGGIFGPGNAQLAGANQDFYSVNQWCDVSSNELGISLFTREACLVEPGEMTSEVPGKFGVKTWRTEPVIRPTLFSYVMNNYWHTNFKADQSGEVTLHYALMPHGAFNQVEIQRKAMEFCQPLVVVPSSKNLNPNPLFRIGNSNVVATLVEPKDDGFRIRFFNVSDESQEFTIDWNKPSPASIILCKSATDKKKIVPGEKLHLPGNGICEIEIQMK